jgi:hypothetical protein
MTMTEKGRLYVNFAGYLAVIVAGALLGVGCGKSSEDEDETVPSNMPSVVEFWAVGTPEWAQKTPAVGERVNAQAQDTAAYKLTSGPELGRLAENNCTVSWSGENFDCPTLGLVKCPRRPELEIPDNLTFRIVPSTQGLPVARVEGPELICAYALDMDTVWGRLPE